MDMFNLSPDPSINLLPYGGEVHYFGHIMSLSKSDHYFKILLENIKWKNDEAVIFGKHIITKRKVAWYADKPFEYTYSNIKKTGLIWTSELIELKELTENLTGETFNSCLLNLYHSGEEGMAWHSDGEKDLKKKGAIASLSFGAERKFAFKNKRTKEVISRVLEHGSLLIMKGDTQENWLHRLPPTKKNFGPRVNLTFRTIEKDAEKVN
ncbi:MAG: alpha-ketoglutarate-dependent dioxygenase AlkB [Saprospiraceae bacterium]|jgi:alkylated DNA repair dioxygenase AlkB|uniref:alpha-ketoglutarate-dependent dioxygenase AlkB family protein n=1 Tax=Candidatus Brachybacter algidus TaxID=2982024 RepID=UPI001B41E5DA|nr:alpha-ketoglutarate-dependent dioxygenase AlkB [Candidatus Brachybacter algidus]MBP7305554.1 alpha-ketoglutarate-dependent dioxygenase AlkB [Saprospiraceae bacterium]MBK6450689.1 alpha-ketoglutarate-dependent dioxygenase AlkB [Candidatus Brachybacter algidus]MBK7604789.1 alpha-ketoglutarate-dependent dioxygenase AlkB [Candidatus Brachybacter algidus]MBK8356318.1 alpha-ketoglutarate-dependent dioxygenase AlkB [Candidatus Brachybacter algidus]MBK8842690.1 alpha-ketoglutarate-dependent dioxyge